MTKYIGVDIETTGLDFTSDRILCIGFSDGQYYDIYPYNITKPKNATIAYHNGSFDTKFLRAQGVIELPNEFDTMIAAYLLKDRPTKLSLDSLVSYYLGLPSWKDDIKSGAIFEDPELLKTYCLDDARYTEQLAYILEGKLREEGRWDFFLKLMQVRRALTDAEYTGINYDAPKSVEYETCLKAELEEVEEALKIEGADLIALYKEQTGAKSFNFNSPKQVLWLLKTLNLPYINTLTKKESSDVSTLMMSAGKNPVIDLLLKARKLKKKITSLESYRTENISTVTGRIHCNFNLSNVRTGRSSSSGPNLQQVDRDPKVRALFSATRGKVFVVGDMAQIEVRMAAHYSKDPTLINMFTRNEDFYGTIAVEVLGSQFSVNEVKEKDPVKRQVAKVIGLSILYGVGPNKLKTFIEEKGGVDYSHTEIRQIITRYFERFSGLKELQMQVHRRADQNGFLTNLFGRQVDLQKNDIYMKGVNSLLQSSASDLLLFRQVEVLEKAPYAKLIATVHDEVIYEVEEGRAQEFMNTVLKPTMEQVDDIKFRVPLKFDAKIGLNWAIK